MSKVLHRSLNTGSHPYPTVANVIGRPASLVFPPFSSHSKENSDCLQSLIKAHSPWMPAISFASLDFSSA